MTFILQISIQTQTQTHTNTTLPSHIHLPVSYDARGCSYHLYLRCLAAFRDGGLAAAVSHQREPDGGTLAHIW